MDKNAEPKKIKITLTMEGEINRHGLKFLHLNVKHYEQVSRTSEFITLRIDKEDEILKIEEVSGE